MRRLEIRVSLDAKPLKLRDKVNIKNRTRFAIIALGLSSPICLGSVQSASAGMITFSTGDFVPSEWSTHILPGSTGTSVAFTEASGGNPGTYRRVSLTVGPFESVSNSQLWSAAEFTPATQGAISSVSLSYDISRVFTSNAGASQVVKGISVRQDGVIYTHFLGVSTVSPPTWESVAAADLVPLFPLVNWGSGSAITFGFFDSAATSATGFTIDGGYDNYSVEVSFTPVPEPSALLLLGFGAWLTCTAKKKFKRQYFVVK